jgi:hypothetical protein
MSSYRVNAEGEVNDLITAHSAYEALSSELAQRRSAYSQLCESLPPSRIEEEIRKATRLGVLAGAVRRARGRPAKVK